LIERGRVRFDGTPAATIQEYRSARPSGDEPSHDGDARITGVQLLDQRGRPAHAIETDGWLTVRIHYETSRPIDRPHFGVDVVRGDGVHCYGTNTRIDRLEIEEIDGAGHVDLVIPRLCLLPGCYSLSVAIQDTHGVRPHDVQYQAYPFSVTSERRDLGLVYLEHRWQLNRSSVGQSSVVNLKGVATR